MDFAADSSVRPRIYGHRGCRGLRPENTLPAFLHALRWPLDGLELDVVVSADGQVVVSHEPWLNAAICTDPFGAPLTPEAGLAFSLYQHDYATIRRCDCGAWPHPGFPEQQAEPAHKPLLHEVFGAVAAHCQAMQRALPAYLIELKSFPTGDGSYHPGPADFVAKVAAVVAAAQATGAAGEVLLMSFDHRVVQAVRTFTPHRVCLLIEDELPLAYHLAQLGFVPDVLGPEYILLTAELLAQCRAQQLPIITWTINDAAALAAAVGLGVQGVTTDYPDRITHALRSL